jgi:hypothetical protein
MTAGDTFCAGAGVAVKANAENATANAVAILPIVFITFSKAEPRWAAGVIECFLSPIGLPALVASVVHLTIESLLCCKQSSPATRPLCGSATFASQPRLLTELRLQETGCEWNVSIRFAMTLVRML